MQLNPGEYFIGDLSYVLSDKHWQALIGEDGFFEIKNAQGFFAGTAYGDGCYQDEAGREYPVDTGTIGIIHVSACVKGKLKQALKANAGQVSTFTAPFSPKRDGDGTFHFGHITIVTGDSDDDEDDEDDECLHCASNRYQWR